MSVKIVMLISEFQSNAWAIPCNGEEECDDNYRKRCYIEFKNVASQEKVEFCFTPLVKNCDIPGPEVCTTEYRSECTTRYIF